MRHRIVLLLTLLLATCLHATLPPSVRDRSLQAVPLAVPRVVAQLGPFQLERAWELRSSFWQFGGYSALAVLPGDRLLAISDRGRALAFSPPDAPGQRPYRFLTTIPAKATGLTGQDSESATRDPVSGTLWLGWERSNAISRQTAIAAWPAVSYPPSMAWWPENRGAEAMVRLADGRFIVLREGFGYPDEDAVFGGTRHEARLFASDPVADPRTVLRFTFAGPDGFSPVDMAQLPDGRVLILMRKLLWPLPARFAGRIVVADPARITAGGVWRGAVVARLGSNLPIDNFEGLAISPSPSPHRVTVWLISDANDAASQRTLLWKLAVDPDAL